MIHTHLHTEISNSILMDSPSSLDNYIEVAKEQGVKFIVTEHGNSVAWYKKKLALEKAGMKYIHAVEGYVCENLEEKKSYHICVYGINNEGRKEINNLISMSYRRDGHFYRRPRFTIDELLQCENVMIATACLGGVVLNSEEILDKLLNWKHAKERLFLEIQPHDDKDQKDLNNRCISLSREHGIKLIASNDVHYARKEDVVIREEMQKSKGFKFDYENTWHLHLKTLSEMQIGFMECGVPTEIYTEALSNTDVLYDMCESYDIDTSFKYPQLYDEPTIEIMDRCKKRMYELGVFNDIYATRLVEEVLVYQALHSESYILLFSDWINGIKDSGVEVGFSRGSASGSLVSYLMGVTDVDPIKFNTSFARFMNKDRVSLADVDIDIFKEDMEIAKEWFFNHEKLNCASIITHGTEQMKGSVKMIFRATDKDVETQNELCSKLTYAFESFENQLIASGENKIGDRFLHKITDLEVLLEKHDCLDLLEYAKKAIELNGAITKIGTHPAGVLVSDLSINIFEEVGTIVIKSSNGEYKETSQLNMKELEALGYVKADALGLATVGVMNKTCEYAKIERPNPQNIDLNDEKVWNNILESSFGIFQFEELVAHSRLKASLSNIKGVDKIMTMSMCSGIIRPSGESIREDYIKGVPHDNGHWAINKLFGGNNGYCVSEGTKISTVDGIVNIEDINVGDFVKTPYGDKMVTHKFINGKKECKKLITKGGIELVATGEHKIMTQCGFKRIDELDIDVDTVAINLNEEYNKKEGRIAYARLLGLLCGDGMLTQKRLIRFISNSESQAVEFKGLVEGLYNDCTVVIRRDEYKDKSDLYVCNVINSTKYSNSIKSILIDLIRDGYKTYNGGCGALEKFIPTSIMNSSINVRLSFLGGLLDTDGCITSSGDIRFKTGSKRLAYDILDICRSVGVIGNIYEPNGIKNSFDITFRGGGHLIEKIGNSSTKIKNANIVRSNNRGVKVIKKGFVDKIYTGGYSKAKYDDATKNNYYSRVKNIKNNTCLERLCDFDSIKQELPSETVKMMDIKVALSEIESIEEVGVRDVYDIEVEDVHMYVANGIVVHNCVYQEDIMLFLKEFCGYSDNESDNVRRAVAKKGDTGHLLTEIRERFNDTFGKKYNEDRETCDRLVDGFLKIVDSASRYGFSYNHSVPYSITGYICGWLRTYYTKEFITARFNVFSDKKDKVRAIYEYINKHTNIKVVSPTYGKSSMEYSFDENEDIIYEGLLGVKGLGKNVNAGLSQLYEVEFDSFLDMLFYIKDNKIKITSKDIDILIQLDFFSKFGGQNKLMSISDATMKPSSKIKYRKLKDMEKVYETLRQYASMIPDMDASLKDKAINQVKLIGTTRIKLEEHLAYVFDSTKRYGRYYIDVFDFKLGEACSYIYKEDFPIPLEKHDMIEILGMYRRNKKAKVGKKWVDTDIVQTFIDNINKL